MHGLTSWRWEGVRMEYSFLNISDERLLETADLTCENGIAVAMHTTGYTPSEDEIVELAIVDFAGNELFRKRVKPQNIEGWKPSEASGGISEADVEDEPELFQFEDEIIELFDKASIVVCEHLDFASSLIESSWISLPEFKGFDLNEEFRLSHCAKDYPGEPASAVALGDIVQYYDVPTTAASLDKSGDLAEQATCLIACYRALIDEHIRERDNKGAAYWEAREQRLAEEASKNAQADAVARLREHRLNQMNGLLWIAGAIIFVSLIIQLWQRGGDSGIMIISGAVAVFCLARGIVNFRK